MKPSKQATEAAEKVYRDAWNNPKKALWTDNTLELAIATAYVIDLVPLEQRIKELESLLDDRVQKFLKAAELMELFQKERDQLKAENERLRLSHRLSEKEP